MGCNSGFNLQNGACVATSTPTCDGVSDDTAALRAQAVKASGGQFALPSGKTCVVHGTIYLYSNTTVAGNGATLLAATPWTADSEFGYAIMENAHHGDSATITDTNISVANLNFRYGDDMVSLPTPAGGKHALRFWTASNINVTNNTFNINGAEDAVAGLGVVNMTVSGNSAYEFRNCAWDFWTGPSNVQVLNNYARTTTSNQMANFNPERTVGSSTGLIANGYLLKGNTFIVTGSQPSALQLEPLGVGTSVRNVTVTGNTIVNATLALRGDTQSAQVNLNQFENLSNYSAIMSYPLNGGSPASITFNVNTITNPSTKVPSNGVIDIEAPGSFINQNAVLGGTYSVPAIYTGSFTVTQNDNDIDKLAIAAIPAGTVLTAGQSLTFGNLTLTMQTDSNLVLYGPSGALWGASQYLNNFVSGVGLHSCISCYAQFQTDGNLVLYDPNFTGNAYWATNTSGLNNAWFNISQGSPYLYVFNNGAIAWPK